MHDEGWGMLLIAYIIPYASWEIYRQARRGNDFVVDRQSVCGAAVLFGLLALWGAHVPPGVGVLLLLSAVTAAALMWLRRFAKRLPTPRWFIGLRRVALLVGACAWVALLVPAMSNGRDDFDVVVAAAFPVGFLLAYAAVEWALRGFLPQDRA